MTLITTTVKLDDTKWNTTGRGPHVGVMGFLFDEAFRFPILFRGPNVRSVKNCWSIPAGLHENGLTMPEQLAVEGMEEVGAAVSIVTNHRYLGAYENIVKDENWHWVMNVLALYPVDLQYVTNMEPDKHTEVTLARFHENEIVRCDTGEVVTNWSPGLSEWLAINRASAATCPKLMGYRNLQSRESETAGRRSIAYWT